MEDTPPTSELPALLPGWCCGATWRDPGGRARLREAQDGREWSPSRDPAGRLAVAGAVHPQPVPPAFPPLSWPRGGPSGMLPRTFRRKEAGPAQHRLALSPSQWRRWERKREPLVSGCHRLAPGVLRWACLPAAGALSLVMINNCLRSFGMSQPGGASSLLESLSLTGPALWLSGSTHRRGARCVAL